MNVKLQNKPNSKENTKFDYRNKNAICYVANFGKTLSECKNTHSNITDKQLDNISTNKIDNVEQWNDEQWKIIKEMQELN